MTEEEIMAKIDVGECPSCGGKIIDIYEQISNDPPIAQHDHFHCENCSADW